MVLQKSYAYDEAVYPPVLARPEGQRSPRSVMLDPSYVQPSAGPDGVIQRICPPAFAVAAIPTSGGIVRPLPRTRLTAAITASSTDLIVAPKTARFFKSTATADSLIAALPYARADFALTWANGDTATMTIAGQSAIHTVANFSTLAALATDAAATFNASSKFAGKAKFYAENQYVHVESLDGKNHAIATAENTAGSGTFAVNGSVTSLQSGTAIGTVSAVNDATNTITLASAASIRLPAGAAIAAAGFPPYTADGDRLGFVSPNNPVDLEWEPNNNWGLWIGGTFYRDRLPYWDGELAALFPEINLV